MSQQKRFAILITRSHCLGRGRGDVFEGTVLTVPEEIPVAEARAKVVTGYAIKVDRDDAASTGAGESEAAAPGAVESREPELEIRDPKPKPAKRKPSGGKGSKTRRGK